MKALKTVKTNFEAKHYTQFTAFNIFAIHTDMLPEEYKMEFLSFLKRNKDTELAQTAFKDVRSFFESIGKPMVEKM